MPRQLSSHTRFDVFVREQNIAIASLRIYPQSKGVNTAACNTETWECLRTWKPTTPFSFLRRCYIKLSVSTFHGDGNTSVLTGVIVVPRGCDTISHRVISVCPWNLFPSGKLTSTSSNEFPSVTSVLRNVYTTLHR